MYRVNVASDLAAPFFSPRVAALPADPPALRLPGRNWLQWVGLGISAATVAAMIYQIRHVDLREAIALLPRTPGFWLVFALYYFGPVLAEWLIFRRLWRIPVSGLFALTRKYVGNELLFGYLGEAYFYIWARRRAAMTGSPFGAIKDVAILSAVVGNVATLAMLAIAYPVFTRLDAGTGGRALYLSMAFLVASSLAVFLFRRRLFGLPGTELRFIASVHLARVLAVILLAGLMWHLALPGIWFGWWVLLAALRQLLSRLPFLPNKDLAFAGLATLIAGGQSQIVALLTMIAGLLLIAHVVAGFVAIAADFTSAKE
jgi:hypothetical protein